MTPALTPTPTSVRPPRSPRLRQITLVAAAVIVVAGAGIVEIARASSEMARSTRSDQMLALTFGEGGAHLALRWRDTVTAPAAAPLTLTLRDGSMATLSPGSHLISLHSIIPFQQTSRSLLLRGAAELTVQTCVVVTTDFGSAVLRPGRYRIRGVPADSGMLVSVVAGSAEAWPVYGVPRDQVHVATATEQWMPWIGPLGPARPLVDR